MKITVGSKVRSFDFEGRRDCYIDGIVLRIAPSPACPCQEDHYHIQPTSRTWNGQPTELTRSENHGVFPPVEGGYVELLHCPECGGAEAIPGIRPATYCVCDMDPAGGSGLGSHE